MVVNRIYYIGAAAFLIFTPSVVPGCFAQVSPGASMQMGQGLREQMTRDQMMRQVIQQQANRKQPPTLRHTMRRDPGVAPSVHVDAKQQRRDVPVSARSSELMRRLAPEYNRRLSRDGEASANEWLARTARKLGQEDAAAAVRK